MWLIRVTLWFHPRLLMSVEVSFHFRHIQGKGYPRPPSRRRLLQEALQWNLLLDPDRGIDLQRAY
ncbi:hypothetical protein Lalb_Chr00c24g0406871 (mitochondrion) [Lupinus albus]|uniref:Uncharacterized protein n=1 Tax=Lupinus albus TaxID=3870 RepID=A0A6A4NCD0_LUPAL|nr:hypothetical protein Lalb_Chr00c24g0406871 [Lupinus albus]